MSPTEHSAPASPSPSLPVALQFAFSAVLAVVLGTAIVSYWNTRVLFQHSHSVVQTHEVRGELSELLGDLEDAETGERGFIITGDETYLAPHDAAVRAVPERLRHLHVLVSDNPDQVRRLADLEPHIDALLALLRETIELRRHNGFADARARVQNGSGKREMEAIREGVRDLDSAEHVLLQQRAHSGDVAARATTATFATAAILAVLLVGLLYAALRRELRVRQDTAQRMAGLLASEQEARRTAEQTKVKLEEMNRAKDAFLATVSHELRTPLSPIFAWTAMLAEGNLDAEQSRRAVDTIARCAKAQAQLVEDLLDVSRIVAGKMRTEVRPVELSGVIRSAVDVVRPAADAKNIRLQLVLDTETAPISGDAERLQQVVWNLVANAVKFTPKGGRVTVVLERVNSHVEIAVSDTGQGIAPDFLPHVFERFQQHDASTTRQHGGLGLGLAIVRHIVEAHGGTAHAESAGPGQGAVFTVKLPLILIARAAGETERRHPTEVALTTRKYAHIEGLRVLLVDDEPHSNEAVSALLSSRGAEVRLAGSAAEALGVLDGWTPDLIVSDIGMPDEDGYGFIAKVRARADASARVPAIALTAYASVEDRVRLLSAGFQMHVPKPVEPVELLAVVASTARREAGSSL